MPETSPRLALPMMMPAQAQKHVTHNEALLALDLVVQLVVEGFDATTPPAAPAEGEVWATGAAPLGAWAGQPAALAVWRDGGWSFVAPRDGWRAWGRAEAALRVFAAGDWTAPPLQELDGLGIGTVSDAVNRLSVAAPGALFSHAGTDHRLAVNKAATADTASLVFQTGFSGRAELGLAGDDGLVVKVSPDGSLWTEALRLDPASGHLSGQAVMQDAADVTPGRLMRADYGYGPGNLLGPVSEVAGVPTGAVIETVSDSGGRALRWADGTQICHHALGFAAQPSGTTASQGWSFPRAFAALPAISASVRGATPGQCAASAVADGGGATAEVHCWQDTGATATQTVDLIAVGRWF